VFTKSQKVAISVVMSVR